MNDLLYVGIMVAAFVLAVGLVNALSWMIDPRASARRRDYPGLR